MGDGCERRNGGAGEGHVVKADDRNVVRHALSETADCPHEPLGLFVVAADDGIRPRPAPEEFADGGFVGRRERELADAFFASTERQFARQPEKAVAPVRICKRVAVLHEKRDAVVAPFMQMPGYLTAGSYVVDGHEVAVASLRRSGDVRVDKHDGHFRTSEDVHDLSVRFGEIFGHERAEDRAFDPFGGKFSYLVKDVTYGGRMPLPAREDEVDAISEPRGVPLNLFFDLREEGKCLKVGDNESDSPASPERALCQERPQAVALLDQSLVPQLVERDAERHARDAEPLCERGFARKPCGLGIRPRHDLLEELP